MPKVIKLQDKTIKELEKFREHPRETWDDIVSKVIEKCKSKKQSK